MKTWAASAVVAVVGLLGLTAISVACGARDGETLVIAVQPTSTAAELSADAEEIKRFLEERLDVDVELTFPTSYAGVIEALRFGHADAAFMGAWPARLAADEAGAEVVLAEVREVIIGDEVQEAPYYYSYWVVPQDSSYDSLEDLRGKRAAFPSQLSTSGYVAPMARLVELGLVERDGGEVDAEDFFGEVFFAGGYAQAWEALDAGQVDVTVIAGDVPQDLYREVLDNTRVIEEQGPVPSHAVVFSNDLEDPLRSQLRDALLELGAEENRELMRKFISGIFLRFEETTTEEHLGTLAQFLGATGYVFSETGGGAAGPQAQPDPEPEAQQTTPEPPPAGATQVAVGLSEWAISAEPATVSAGEVYFLVTNTGAEAHEFVVIRSDAAPDALPVVDGQVPEDEVDMLGEIEPFAPGAQASIVFDLAPGSYVFICNIVEKEESGELESHYEEGMATSFAVE
jgi:phosphonate transport system substrate-binding protein